MFNFLKFYKEILMEKSTPTTFPTLSDNVDMMIVSEVLLMRKSQLQQLLSNSPKDKLFVVLTIPLFPNWMEEMVKVFSDIDDTPTSNRELSGLIGEHHSKEVMDKIREIDDHVKQNQSTVLTNPLFIVAPGEKTKDFRCCYSIYKGEKLWKSNLNRLPSPPSSVRVKQNKSNLSIQVEWHFENPGYAYKSMILYRPKSYCDCTVSWIRQKATDQMKTTIHFEPGSAIEILIAMDTCIGRSEFCSFETQRLPISVLNTRREIQNQAKRSPVVEKDKAGPPQPTAQKASTSSVPPTCLEVELVTDCTAELLWLPSTAEDFQVNYWRHGKGSSAQSLNIGPSIGCRLKKLQAGTTYSFNIYGAGQETSSPSQSAQFTTPKTKVFRFAEKMVKSCERIQNENGLDLYAVPLTKSFVGKVEYFSFGEVDQSKQHKTIMLIGLADTDAQLRLINGMVNYIFDVDWLDNFRFQLIDKESDAASEVPVKIYNIHHMEGFRIPYSLTIINVPYRVGVEEDRLNKNPRCIPFSTNGVVYNPDLVISVSPVSHPPSCQFYMFDSIMAVYKIVEFINDENRVQLNLKNGKPLLHKFDSSAFFCWNRKTEQVLKSDGIDAPRRHHFQCYYREYKLNRFMWFMNIKNFECMFSF